MISLPSQSAHSEKWYVHLSTRSPTSPEGSPVHNTGLHCNHAVWWTWSVKIWGLHQIHEVSFGQSHLWSKRADKWRYVTKMLMSTLFEIWDCKHLRPKESTTMRVVMKIFQQQFERPDEDIIMAAFPNIMLTNEVKTRVTNCLDYMEQSHSAAVIGTMYHNFIVQY